MKSIQEILAQRIKEMRKLRGMNQSDLADACGKSISAIAQIETCVIWPTPDTVSAIAKALHTPPASLFVSPADKVNDVVETLETVRDMNLELVQDPKYVQSALRSTLEDTFQCLKRLNLGAETLKYPAQLMSIITQLTNVCVQLSTFLKGEAPSSHLSPDILAKLRGLDEGQVRALMRTLELEEEGKREAQAEALAEANSLHRKGNK